MRARRAVVLGVVAWVVVAVAGIAVVWGVISRAGQGVSGQVDASPTAAGAAPATPTGRRTLSPSTSPTSDPSPRPTTGPPASATGAPPSSDQASPGGPVEPAVVTRTWQGVAGSVSATCEGAVIALSGATAYSGYRVERDDTGPDRVRVEFENDDTDVRVEAECVDGVPVFAAA